MTSKASFLINKLILISAPRHGEEGTPRRLEEDIAHIANSLDGLNFEHIMVDSKLEFIEALISIENDSTTNGVRPFLHFDMHGDSVFGLEIGRTRENVGWLQLTYHLRRINISTKNNLGVFITACHGFHVINAISILEPCPFYIMLASEKEITVGTIEQSVSRFYGRLLESMDVNEARKAISSEFEYFNAEKVFSISWIKYLRKGCLGKSRAERNEQLMSTFFNEKKFHNNRANRRSVRKSIKNHTKSNRGVMYRYAKLFLHGRRLAMTYEELMELAKNGRASGQIAQGKLNGY